MSDSTSNPQAHHLEQGGAFGFYESGQRVPVVWPGEATTWRDDLVELLTGECNFRFEDAETAARAADRILTAEARAMAADALRQLLLVIADTKTGKSPEFRALLAIFSPDKPAAEIAREGGMSKQALAYHVEKLRSKFDALRIGRSA